VAEGWGGGAALGPALTPAPVTPGILPSALRARLRRFEIRSRQICPQAAQTRHPSCGNQPALSDRKRSQTNRQLHARKGVPIYYNAILRLIGWWL